MSDMHHNLEYEKWNDIATGLDKRMQWSKRGKSTTFDENAPNELC